MVFWATLLTVHGLLALALLRAISDQAVALWWPPRNNARGMGTMIPSDKIPVFALVN